MTEETKLLLEMSGEVKALVKTTTTLSEKMDKLQDEFVTQMTSRMAVQEEKVGRLERILYGFGTMAVAEMLYIIFDLIKK
jgi:hypothetical protein